MLRLTIIFFSCCFSYICNLTGNDFLSIYAQLDKEIEKQLVNDHLIYIPKNYSIDQIVAIGDKICNLTANYYYQLFPSNRSLWINEKTDLEIHGCQSLDLQLTTFQIDEIMNFLLKEPIYYGHTIRDKEDIPPAPNISYFHNNVGCYGPSTIARCPHLIRLASSPAILNFIERYLGCPPTLFDFNILWTFDNFYIHSLHRDDDDFRQVTLFVYLSDVLDDDSSPHTYIMGTHRGAPTGISHTFYGKAGTSFLTDSLGLHKGGTPKNGKHRLVFWARYGLGKNYVYNQKGSFHDLDTGSKKIITQDVDLSDPRQVFLWRLFLNNE